MQGYPPSQGRKCAPTALAVFFDSDNSKQDQELGLSNFAGAEVAAGW